MLFMDRPRGPVEPFPNRLVAVEVVHGNDVSEPQLLLPVVQARPHPAKVPQRPPTRGREPRSRVEPIRLLLVQQEDVSVRRAAGRRRGADVVGDEGR